ncbi:DUF2065 domain-containing protein [Consotaella aegiceratis]|uniref:DUF2065 domain-containing protein n=1 Tax=Consotaella aegiceratis TaxID=3097961 RepID=UPI002F403942
MTDLFAALALIFVIEGALYALFPEAVRRMGRSVQDISETKLRAGGLAAAVFGVLLVWLVRGG